MLNLMDRSDGYNFSTIITCGYEHLECHGTNENTVLLTTVNTGQIVVRAGKYCRKNLYYKPAFVVRVGSKTQLINTFFYQKTDNRPLLQNRNRSKSVTGATTTRTMETA